MAAGDFILMREVPVSLWKTIWYTVVKAEVSINITEKRIAYEIIFSPSTIISRLQFTRVEEHQSFSFTSNIILMDHGVYLAGAWDKAKIDMDYNCYWDLRNNMPPKFLDNDWKTWKGMKDKHSIIQDPAFKDPYRLDFHFKNQKAIRKIRFKPFDYEKAGVYGSDEWIQKARLPKRTGRRNSTRSYGKGKSRYRHCLNKQKIYLYLQIYYL